MDKQHWPHGVKGISIDGLGKLGVDPVRNRLYWDGQELAVSYRLATFERVVAAAAALATVVSAVVMVGGAAGWWPA